MWKKEKVNNSAVQRVANWIYLEKTNKKTKQQQQQQK